MVRALAAGPSSLRRRAGLEQEEVLRAGNAALSLGRAAHGPRAQLLDRRRASPLHVDERLQRAASHGMGFVWLAGGERRDLEQHASARVDLAQHREHEGADEAPGFALRLVARGHDLPAGILPLEPVVLPEAFRARFGVSQEEQGELVPEMRNRAGQRTGGERRHAAGATKTRWSSSANWNSGSSAPPSTPKSCCAIWTSLEGWPEKVRTMQRNWIGRSEGTLVDFKLDGNAGPAGSTITVFTTRVDTIFGATSVQLAPEHPMVADFVRFNRPLGERCSS